MKRSAFGKPSWRAAVAVACLALVGIGGFAFSRRTAAEPVAAPEAPKWFEDLSAAMVAAQTGKKDIVLEFSAPERTADPATAIERTLLDKEPFRRTIGENFVLLRMAVSRDTGAARITQVTSAAHRLGVERFPTFVLLDANGKPYAKSELVSDKVEKYESEFLRLRQSRVARDKSLALAAAAKGIERARLLDAALTAVGSFAESDYGDVQRQVIALDPQNAAGLKSKYESGVIERQIDATIQTEIYPMVDRGDYRGAITRIGRLIDELKPTSSQKQLLMAFKGQLYFSMGDRKRAAQLLDEAIALDPASESAGRARAAKLQFNGDR